MSKLETKKVSVSLKKKKNGERTSKEIVFGSIYLSVDGP